MFYVHAIVGRMSHSFAPDLYKHMKLDAADECAALGILLAARDADLEGHGVTANDPRRKEIQLCYSILSKPEVRKHYDDAIAAGRKITWPEVEHLANFGTWPDPVTRMNVSESPQQTHGWSKPQGRPQQGPQRQQPQQFAQPQPQQSPQQQPQQAPYAQTQQPQASPYAQPFNPYQQPNHQHQQIVPQQTQGVYHPSVDPAVADRPSSGTRVGMAFLDYFLLSIVPLALVAGDSVVAGVVAGILVAVLFVGTEVAFGGSPAKLMLGYRVRDVNTGEKLSIEKSIKRQWFRSILIVPGLGQTVGLIGAIATSFTINPANELRGAHDRWADAEVVKKK